MTTHRTGSGLGASAGERRDGLLWLSLKLDAAASGALGVLALVAGAVLDGLLGTPLALLVPVGLFLVAFAASVWVVGTRPRIDRTAARSVVAVNLVWVLASIALVAAGPLPLTIIGVAFVLAQAAAVLLFADLQFLGLRRARPDARSAAG